jgi:L-glyceraldehyde 3-phosphate reductase
VVYRRCGRSGILLPVIAVGLWQNFGGDGPSKENLAIIRGAFAQGVTHFDLANNYGPPYGSAEANFGKMLKTVLAGHRDELVISTKAGWDMWPGPYGNFGSRKHLLASLDQSLARMGLDYVDIFYHHRPDPETPLEETMGALATAVHLGKALYVGVSQYPPAATREAVAILRRMGVHLLIHQPVYSMLNRWIEPELLGVLQDEGVGCIAFAPLAHGMLTDRYLHGIPPGSRASRDNSLREQVSGQLDRIIALNQIAERRGQKLSQMALAWVFRDQRVTSALIGVSSERQLEENLAVLDGPEFTEAELAEVDHVTSS